MTPDDGTPEELEDEPTRRESAEIVPESDAAPEQRPAKKPERNTGTYAGSPEFVAGREAGFDAGYKAGVDKAIAALRVELLRASCTEDEIARVAERIRAGTNRGR